MISLSSISVSAGLAVGGAALLVYSLAKVVYYLYFNPIANFPGPKLAAMSFWQVISSHLLHAKANLYEV